MLHAGLLRAQGVLDLEVQPLGSVSRCEATSCHQLLGEITVTDSQIAALMNLLVILLAD